MARVLASPIVFRGRYEPLQSEIPAVQVQAPCDCHSAPCDSTLDDTSLANNTATEVNEDRMFYPVQAVTAEDIKRANAKAFINEVVQEEDLRIARLAEWAAQDALEAKSTDELSLVEAKERGQAVAQAALAVTGVVVNKISSETKSTLNFVAESSMDSGRRAQAAEDQVAIANLFGTKAQETQAAAADAEAAAHEQKLQVSAFHQAAEEFGARAASNAASAGEVKAVAVKDRLAADDMQAEVAAQTDQSRLAAKAQARATKGAFKYVQQTGMDEINLALAVQGNRLRA